MQLDADSSLLDAARRIAPIIRDHKEEAERERRLSGAGVGGAARQRAYANVHPTVIWGPGNGSDYKGTGNRRGLRLRYRRRLDAR
jgi:hypothetical protein